MAGNKAVYDTAMKRAHDHAWANHWERAIKEYDRALSEFPDDVPAERNKAQCLFRMRRWPEALTAYSSLVDREPTDLFALNRLAEVHLAVGRHDEAVAAYFRLADLYSEQKRRHEAIRALRDLARALPDNRETHARLLNLTHEVGDRTAEIAEHIALSRIALDAGDLEEGMREAEAASALGPDNQEARRWSYAVRRRLAQANATSNFVGDADATGQMPASMGTGLIAQQEEEPAQVVEFIERATEAQNAGDYRLAMDLYDKAVRAGAIRPLVFYSAGLLNQQHAAPEMAIPLLERAAKDPEYGISANYALGQCYSAMRDHTRAVQAFERALGLIVTANLTRAEADELIELYTSASDAHLADNNPGRASSLLSSLVKVIKQKKWAHPGLPALERRADELYSRSIMSKLDGISKGSAALGATADMPAGSAGMPTPPSMPEVASLEATRIMVEGAADGTNQLPTQAINAGDASAAETEPAGEHEDEGFELKKYSTDIPTTMMRRPGSNLRTITEYLRAADVSPGPDMAEHLPFSQHPDPEPAQDPQSPIHHPESHTFTALSTQALMGLEAQNVFVQRAIAEAELAMHEGLWDAVLDSALSVIEWDPEYLPIHILMADVYRRQGKNDEAGAKYQTVMDTYMVRQDPGSAAEVCRRLMELEPDNPNLQSRLGLMFLEAGRVGDAAEALLVVPAGLHRAGETKRALEEAELLKEQLPDSAQVAMAVGTYLMALGRMPEALAELSRALHLDPGNNSALARLYVLLASTGEPAEWDALQSLIDRASKDPADNRLFMEELHAAVQRDPRPGIYYGLSVLAERVGLADIAADALDAGLMQLSLSDTQEIGEWWLLLEALMSQSRADLALNAKDWGIAAQLYSRALSAINSVGLDEEGHSNIPSPRPQYNFLRVADMPHLYYGLAEAQASQSNWEAATEALAALKLLMPHDPSVYSRLADIYFRIGRLGQALAELNELLVYHQKSNDHEKTLETLGHMARLAPNNVPVRRKLADMYVKLGMTDHGLTELNTLAELQLKAGHLKDAMSTYRKAADMHYTLGRHEEALEIYGRIVRIAPRDIDARQQLINMYVQSGKVADAVKGERALAELFIQDGYTEEAISALHQLLALSPEDVPAHHKLAQQLTALGKYGEAARLYGRLVRLEPKNSRNAVMQTEMQRMAKEAQGHADEQREQKEMAAVSGKRGR